MKKTAAALLALTATSVAFAAPSANSFYVTGKVGYTNYHNDVQLNTKSNDNAYRDGDGVAYGLFLGYRLNNHVAFELGWQKPHNNNYNYNDTTTFTHKSNVLDLGVKFNQFIGSKVNVFAGLGAGVFFNKVVTASDVVSEKTQVAPYASAGLEYYFVDSFAVGVEYKAYFRTFNDSKVNAASGSYAVTLADSVNNNSNRYRPDVHLVQATATYVFGQSKPVEVAPVVTTEKFELKSDVLFALNSDKLGPNAAESFKDVLARYNNPNATVSSVEVVGHADRTGSAAYNLKLSERRAQTVANYLVENGVDQSLLTVKGVGSAEPVTNGCYDVKGRKALAACLAPDRRVDVYVTGTKESK
ncbi:OmpA family protein [Psittacicella gerlachiana]|uniref:OmpA-like domain-containing protein n=1 Tax=Psittacicella gerlachiana TaxID=2028574 RepID=A0A3A1Y8S4_9GAMM|nr:OmpA family protein [Psittacicella gerlachiana]RIY34713.1 hypothetical protein CKF59_05015 [Psittacicella gerlachiana]